MTSTRVEVASERAPSTLAAPADVTLVMLTMRLRVALRCRITPFTAAQKRAFTAGVAKAAVEVPFRTCVPEKDAQRNVKLVGVAVGTVG